MKNLCLNVFVEEYLKAPEQYLTQYDRKTDFQVFIYPFEFWEKYQSSQYFSNFFSLIYIK